MTPCLWLESECVVTHSLYIINNQQLDYMNNLIMIPVACARDWVNDCLIKDWMVLLIGAHE